MIEIIWECKRKIDSKIANGIRKVIKDTFSTYTHVWEVYPISLVGKNSKPFEIRDFRTDNITKKPTIEAYVRPFGRESCWKVVINPPPAYKLEDVVENISKLPSKKKKVAKKKKKSFHLKKTPPKPKKEQPTYNTDSRTVSGHVYKATVASRCDYGIEITLNEHDTNGLIPIEELAEEYSKEEILKWDVGDQIKVMFLKPGKFSKKEADRSKEAGADVFTGIPDNNGKLSLKGYMDDLERMFEVGNYFADAQELWWPEAAPKEEVYKYIVHGIKKKTGAKVIDKSVMHRLMAKLVNKGYAEKVQKEGKLYGFIMTNHGYVEFERQPPDKNWLKNLLEPDTESEPIESEPELSNPEPELEPVAAEYEYGLDSDQVDFYEEPKPEQVKSYREINIVDLMKKTAEYTNVLAGIKELEAHKNELETWFVTHKKDIDEMNSEA